MNKILRLVIKDLVRRSKHPVSTFGLMLMPLVMVLMIAVVFGGGGGENKMPPIKIILVDLDDDLLSSILRSSTGQRDLGKGITLYTAKTVDEGLSRLEEEKASALVVLPEGLTDDLLDGKETTLAVYRNPAQSMLPDIAVQGTRIVALGLSILAKEFGEPLREIRKMIDADEPPPDWKIAALAVSTYTRIRAAEAYLESPLITFDTMSVDQYKEKHGSAAPRETGTKASKS
ncbi:MAG: ABC transporter permease [bacterium]